MGCSVKELECLVSDYPTTTLMEMGGLDLPNVIPTHPLISASKQTSSQALDYEAAMLERIKIEDVLEVTKWHRHLPLGCLVRVQKLCAECYECLEVVIERSANSWHPQVYMINASKLSYPQQAVSAASLETPQDQPHTLQIAAPGSTYLYVQPVQTPGQQSDSPLPAMGDPGPCQIYTSVGIGMKGPEELIDL
eukprot:TRINITY_DN5236_c0_g1_i1.p1 TRINITY_DN5236_c0_g1~~TRINITY_DN5236_c0_g1_i1.p1  ORF type:complete len:193 (-),score=8.47 TRINITY_DN5236_c0_g1_i1:55-633(-)